MKKQRIVIASILKPVDDTRMLDKMGRTLEAAGSYEVFIIGYPSRSVPNGKNIALIPLKKFKRLSLSRLLAPLKVMVLTFKLKPQVVIVNTHELLFVAFLNRIFFGTEICYDIRENYYRNLRFSNAFPTILRTFLAVWVRAKERAFAPFIRHFFLAEKGYAKEMNFFGGRDIVIENKAVVLSGLERKPAPGLIRLLFSGTLSEATGIFEVIRLAKHLHAVTESIRLTIVGYTAVYETMKKINHEIAGLTWISVIGGLKLVPHEEVVKAIYSSDFGLINYPDSPHTENSIPTKLYEYLSYSLPILLQNKPEWVAICAPFQAYIPIDFKNPDSHNLIEKMQSTEFYSSPATGTTWNSEGEKLLKALS